MIAPSIQLAPGMSAENITSSVHAFETGVGTGASFAEHLDRAVQSSPRRETQPSDSRSTTPKPASDDTQTQRRQATGARPTTSQTKQNSGTTGKTSTSDQALNSDRVQKDDEQRQPANGRNRDSQSSDDSRNAAGRQAGDEETPAKGKSRFAQAIAQSAASQSASAASSATKPAETSTQPSDASIPAALLALLQAGQSPATVQPETTTDNGLNAAQTDSGSTDDAGPATQFNVFPSLNFDTPNTAYQAALTSFQTSIPAAQSTSWNGTLSTSQASLSAGTANSLSPTDQQTAAPSSKSAAASTESSTTASQATSEDSNSVPPSASMPQANAPSVSTASTTNAVAVAAPASLAANTSPVASTAAPASQATSSTNGQQAETEPAPTAKSPQAESADLTNAIKNLKSDAGQHKAAKPALEALTAAAKAKAEPMAAELQQAVTSVNVFTNRASSPALSRQVSAAESQALTASEDSGPTASAAQDSTSGWADSSTGDSAEDDASAQSSSASQGSNGSKSGGSAVEFLPSSAFNSDAVGGVAPTAVHAVAAGTLESNTGFENASFKAPEAAQNFNTTAQEKAFAAWQSVSAQIGRVVNSATLDALQNGTEMRVQLRTDAFGSMDIRATLEGGKVGAAIGVESAEAHNALLSQLPALQQSLNERQVQLDQISVVNSYGQSGTDFGTGSGKQNGDSTPPSGYHQQASGPARLAHFAYLYRKAPVLLLVVKSNING